MLKRKLTKASRAIKQLLKSGKNVKKYLLCKECEKTEVEVSQDIKDVICAYCVQKFIAPPVSVQKALDGEKFPRGWALKSRYVHTDGRVFCKGKHIIVIEKHGGMPKIVKADSKVVTIKKKKTSARKK